MYKILLIEDDISLVAMVEEDLEKWGYRVSRVDDFENIVDVFLKIGPDLVLLDINLPYFDGFHWCRKIREISQVPIIFMSSRDGNMDIIMAVNMGGDDFITKPFSMDILVAKIQAVTRRAYSYLEVGMDLVEVDSVILNVAKGRISYGGEDLELTKNEFKIVELLMKNRGKIIPRERIMKVLWDSDYFISENTLTVNINRLRKSLETIGIVDFIKTKKSQGYMIE